MELVQQVMTPIEFSPWNLHEGRREQVPQSFLLTFIHAQWYVSPNTTKFKK